MIEDALLDACENDTLEEYINTRILEALRDALKREGITLDDQVYDRMSIEYD